MNRFMVIIMKTGFAVLFLAVFAVILALGCAAAFGAAFCGIAAVELGFVISGAYLRVRKRCDVLLGWKPL